MRTMKRINPKKKIITLVLVALVSLPISFSWASPWEVKNTPPTVISPNVPSFQRPTIDLSKYDLDGDGNVTIAELNTLKATIKDQFGESQAEKPLEGDVNSDGRVTQEDLDEVNVLLALFEEEPSAEAPLEATFILSDAQSGQTAYFDSQGRVSEIKDKNGDTVATFEYEEQGGRTTRRIQKDNDGEVIKIWEYNPDGTYSKIKERIVVTQDQEIALGWQVSVQQEYWRTHTFDYKKDFQGNLIEKIELTEEQGMGTDSYTFFKITTRYDTQGNPLWKVFEDSQGNKWLNGVVDDEYLSKGSQSMPGIAGRIVGYESDTTADGKILGTSILTLENVEYELQTQYKWDAAKGEWEEVSVFKAKPESGVLVRRDYDLEGNLISLHKTELNPKGERIEEDFFFSYTRNEEENRVEVKVFRGEGGIAGELVETRLYDSQTKNLIQRTIHNYRSSGKDLSLKIEITFDEAGRKIIEERNIETGELFTRKVLDNQARLTEYYLYAENRKFSYEYPVNGNHNFILSQEIELSSQGEVIKLKDEPKVLAERGFDPVTGSLVWERTRINSERGYSLGPVNYVGGLAETDSELLFAPGQRDGLFTGKKEEKAESKWINPSTQELKRDSFYNLEEGKVYLTPEGSKYTKVGYPKKGFKVYQQKADGTTITYELKADSLGRKTWQETSRTPPPTSVSPSQSKPTSPVAQTKPAGQLEEYKPEWWEDKQFQDFRKKGIAACGGMLSEDNIIHGLLFLEQDISNPEDIKKAYQLLGEIIQKVKEKVDPALTPQEKLGKVNEILTQDFGIEFKGQEVSSLSQNLLQRSLDCDTASFVYLAIAGELNWPLFAVNAPEHVFIRWDDGQETRFNFETMLGTIKPDSFYKKWLNIDEKSIKQGVYLKNLSSRELYGNFYANRGLAKSALKDYPGALADYDQAINLNPNYALAYYNRGNAKSALKDYPGALADYDQAINLNPNYALAYYNRGNAKSALKDYPGALADYDQA
ncbi:MAG: tetratricopeptide repeat protein, partial [Candidatus Desantisbacteria bacterium]